MDKTEEGEWIGNNTLAFIYKFPSSLQIGFIQRITKDLVIPSGSQVFQVVVQIEL